MQKYYIHNKSVEIACLILHSENCSGPAKRNAIRIHLQYTKAKTNNLMTETNDFGSIGLLCYVYIYTYTYVGHSM